MYLYSSINQLMKMHSTQVEPHLPLIIEMQSRYSEVTTQSWRHTLTSLRGLSCHYLSLVYSLNQLLIPDGYCSLLVLHTGQRSHTYRGISKCHKPNAIYWTAHTVQTKCQLQVTFRSWTIANVGTSQLQYHSTQMKTTQREQHKQKSTHFL